MRVSKARATAVLSAVAMIAVLVLAVGASGGGKKDDREFGASLNGYQEVPSISTRGHGTLSLRIRNDSITYRLSYRNLESAAQQAHIHFAQKHVNGGVVAFLCGGGGKPACPPSGSVNGTIVAADIQAVPAQGIAAGELTEVIRAIRAGAAYANVHTTTFGSGEIRGQIGNGGDAKGGDDDNDKKRSARDDD